EYLFPAIQTIASDEDPLVRYAMARSIGPLSTAAQTILDLEFDLRFSHPNTSQKGVMNALATEGSFQDKNLSETYDGRLIQLRNSIKIILQPLLISPHPEIRLGILEHIENLSKFFGTVEIIRMNDKKFSIRAAYCRALARIGKIVGKVSVEQFILPCYEAALLDADEHVITAALYGLASIIKDGLITSKPLLQELSATRIGPALLLPDAAIRIAALRVFFAIENCIGSTAMYAFILPKLRIFCALPLFSVNDLAFVLKP
ncbi:hypothetical protein IE077_002061, partial [Cardiosporidium cionae]